MQYPSTSGQHFSFICHLLTTFWGGKALPNQECPLCLAQLERTSPFSANSLFLLSPVSPQKRKRLSCYIALQSRWDKPYVQSHHKNVSWYLKSACSHHKDKLVSSNAVQCHQVQVGLFEASLAWGTTRVTVLETLHNKAGKTSSSLSCTDCQCNDTKAVLLPKNVSRGYPKAFLKPALCSKKTVSRTCKGSSEKLAGSPGWRWCRWRGWGSCCSNRSRRKT